MTLHAFPIRPAQHWPIAELSEVTDLLTDGTHYTPPDLGQGIPFLTVKDVSEEGLDFQSCSKISRSEYDAAERQNSAPKKGDVLFSKDGTVGKVHLVREDRPFAVLSSLAILRPARQIDGAYLAHFLRTPSTIDAASKKKTGSAIRRIILRDLATLRIPLPPLNEQRRIAAILDKADALRRKRKRAMELLAPLTQSIFLDMFGDPKSNPKRWDSLRLGDLCDVGSSKRVFVEEFVERGVPFYRGTEVGKLAAGHNIEPDLFIAPGHYDDLISHSGAPEIGDLLLPSICHDGRIWKVDNPGPFYFKDGRVLWIKSHQAQINSEYLRRYLQNRFLSDYASIASGTTFAELKIINLKNLSVLVPPIKLQTEFSTSITAIEAMRLANQQSKAIADFLFSSLQHRAFSGQL